MSLSSIPALLRRVGARLARSANVRRFLHGAAWLVAGSVLLRVGPLLAGLAAARLLGRTGMGGVSLVLGTANLVATLLGSGLGAAVTRFVAAQRVQHPEAAGRVIGTLVAVAAGLSVALSLLVVAFAEPIASAVFREASLAGAVRAVSPLIVLTVLGTVQSAALSGLEAFRTVGIAASLGTVALLAALLPAARAFGVSGVAGALGLQAGVMAAAQAIGLRRACREHGVRVAVGAPAAELWPLAHFAVPAVLSAAMYTPVTWYGTVILARSPGGVAQLGLFGAAQHWFAAIAFIPTALTPLVLSLMASRKADDRRSHAKLLAGSLAVNGAMAGGIAALAILLARPILSVYGPEFAAALGALRLLAIAAFLAALLLVVGQLIAAQASMWWGFSLNGIWAATFLALALWLAPSHGAEGLAVAYLASYAVHLASCTIYLLLTRRGRTDPVSLGTAPAV